LKVLVNGAGNIGTTLANILLEYHEPLGIGQVLIHKNRPYEWLSNDLDLLREKGAEIIENSGIKTAAKDADYIFDCTTNGMALKNLGIYRRLPALKGACAQGSEKGFGTPFMSGVNGRSVGNEKFVTVVSCNTHAIVSIMQAVAGRKLENLDKADFVMVRRSEDIGSHQRLVGANVIARHVDESRGTHHGVDAVDLFRTIGINPEITVSAVTTPSQIMHCARFSIDLKQTVDIRKMHDSIHHSDFLSVTRKFDSNAVFELGRRHGFQGRIFSHAIVVTNNLLVSDRNIKGWAFIPQEANTMLSTIEAFLLQTGHKRHRQVFDEIRDASIRAEW
jgi:glyceraldehyde-3-phosphate dehydrogenase type II